jgi:Tfp pilus assembly protein PilN
MIEINLLPEELRHKTKGKKTGPGIETKHLLYIVPFIFGVLICAHFYLAVANIIKSQQFRILNNKWQSLESQRSMLESFKKENAVLSQDTSAIQEMVGKRVDWSEKLNKLSLDLPSGVWFNELSISAKDFMLYGSAVSLQKQEMNLIKGFMDNLRNDKSFFKDFNNLDLSSVQRKTVGGYEIVDFIFTGTLKSR